MKLAYSACRPRVSNATVCLDERVKLAIQRMVLTASDTNEDREERRRARQGHQRGLPNLVGNSWIHVCPGGLLCHSLTAFSLPAFAKDFVSA